jgi:hypothetical protein
MNLAFNGVKSVNILLFKDAGLCEDSRDNVAYHESAKVRVGNREQAGCRKKPAQNILFGVYINETYICWRFLAVFGRYSC